MNIFSRVFGTGCNHDFTGWFSYNFSGWEGEITGEYRICTKCGFRESK